VHGVLNVITPPDFFSTFFTTGNVLTQIPYAYTVGKAASPATAATVGN
jgi:hypothetical protein